MPSPRYIVIEGPIGVGKTTLTKMLAGRIVADLLLEEVETNPFLGSFYKEPERFAFQTQLFFLLSRYRQQEAFRQQPLFGRGMISDYLFAKDRIFAHLTLGDDELALYEKVFKVLDTKVVRPDLVVYLQATPETLLQRVRGRGHEFERPIKESYLENLVKSYNHFFFHYTDTPLLVVNTTDLDIVRNPEDLTDLVKEILTMRGGVKHYLPLAK